MTRANRVKAFFSSKGLWLFSLSLIVYNINFRLIFTNDSRGAWFLPLSIIQGFNLNLDEFGFLFQNGLPYFLTAHGEHIYSNYSIVAPIFAVPIYLIPTLAGWVTNEYDVILLAKISASIMASFSVLLVYLTLKRMEAGAWFALLIAGSYAFATSVWTISAQSLWEHTSGGLFMAAALFCVVSAERDRRYLVPCGAASALAVASRMNNLIIVLALSAYLLVRHRTDIWLFIIFPIIIGLMISTFNYLHFGTLLGGPGELMKQATARQNIAGGMTGSFFGGFAGILFSPSRGLFIFSPWLIFCFAGMIAAWLKRAEPLFKWLSIGVVLTVFFFSKYSIWWGGLCYGPRFLTDILPIMVLFPYFLKDSLQRSRALTVLMGLLILVSILVQAIGAFNYDANNWYYNPTNVDYDQKRLWDWRDTPITRSLANGPQEPVLLKYLLRKSK